MGGCEIRRAMVCNAWSNMFKKAQLHNLKVSSFDHCPLFLIPVSQFPTSMYRVF